LLEAIDTHHQRERKSIKKEHKKCKCENKNEDGVMKYEKIELKFANNIFLLSLEWCPFAHVAIDHSQRLNSEKPLGPGCCEGLWSIATWANGMLRGFYITNIKNH